MTLPRALAVLAIAATLLTGCSAAAPTPAPEPTPEFDMPSIGINDWEESTTAEFVAAFPDVDTSFVSDIPELVVQRNKGAWSLGSGTTLSGFAIIDTWARSHYEIEDDGDDRSALIVTDTQVIKFIYRPMNEGFIAHFFISD